MEPPAPSDRFEDLLAHRAWVRRVARALVLDESRAEDLEQETWIRALGAPPLRSPRAWLGTLLRNGAVNLRLAERRRGAHEAAAPPPRADADPAELLERAEAVERVARAVRTLEEPYRTAILLRYFEDLPVAAVAARTGAPLETVRTRLRRALALLRERLDEGSRGDRRRWMLLLAPLARPPAPLGGLAMTVQAKAAIAAAVLLLLVGGGALWAGGAKPRVAPEPTPPAAVAKAPGPPQPSPVPAAPAAARPILVIDPDGRAVARASIDSLGLEPAGIDGARPAPKPLGRSDAEGRIPWPAGEIRFPIVVRATAPGFAPGEAVAVSREAEVVVRLARSQFLEGRVVGPDGAPVAGAAVTATVLPSANILGNQLGATGSCTGEARSGADGRFRVEGLPPSAAGIVSARAAGFMEGRVPWKPFESSTVEIALERPYRAVVRVRDAAGKPVEGATVFAFHGPRIAMGRWMMPEAEVVPLPSTGSGEYARDDLPPGWYWLLVAAKGFRMVVDEGAAFGRTQGPVEVALEEAAVLRGRVVGYETKEPVAGVRIRATPLRPVAPTADAERAMDYVGPVAEMDGPFVATTAADGTYELAVFTPADRFRVDARGEDGSRGSTDFPSNPKTEDPGIPDVWLHRDREIDYTGRVVSDLGEPIPGAVVQGGAAVASTGPDGRFRIVGKQPGTNLQFLAPGFLPRMRFAPGATPTGGGFGARDFGDVALARLREIRGSVIDPAGRPVAGLFLWAEPADRSVLQALFQEYRFTGGTGRTDADGRVSLRVVPGCRYSVHPFSGPARGAVEVAGDGGEMFSLVVEPEPRPAPGTIRGRLRLEDGTWKRCRVTVGLRPESGGSSGGLSGAADPEGGFAIPGVPAGRWALRVSGSEDVSGELAGVAVPAEGSVEVEIPCRWLRKEGDAPLEISVKVEPAAEGTRAWATGQPNGESRPLAVQPDGTWRGRVRTGAPHRIVACDTRGRRAGVAAVEGESVSIRMEPAGVLLPPGWEYGAPEPWIEVRDASGAVLYSGGQSGLPVIPDSGYALVLPPGTYRTEISVGRERKDPRTFTATAVAGMSKRIE